MILSSLLSGVTGFSNACSFLPAVIPLCYHYDCKNVYYQYSFCYIIYFNALAHKS